MSGAAGKRLNVFERYLSIWVALCMLAGIVLGKLLPGFTAGVRRLEFGEGSRINVAIAVLIWLMVYPMMLKIDLRQPRRGARAAARDPGHAFRQLAGQAVLDGGDRLVSSSACSSCPGSARSSPTSTSPASIILAAAPCTAMVFVWSYLTDGDPAYTLVQVSLNDLVMLVLFAPIVGLLVTGASDADGALPGAVAAASSSSSWSRSRSARASRVLLLRTKGRAWFEGRFLPAFHPVTVVALLATLVLIFAFQADNLTGRFFHVVLIAIPLLVQVYFNSGLAYGLMKWLKVPHDVAAPGALIGASNFFELAVATAIALFGPESGAALATVVGVLVEVPVMLSVCSFCNRTRHWFPAANGTATT